MSKIGLWRRCAGSELMSESNEFGFVKELVPENGKNPEIWMRDVVMPRLEQASEALGYPIGFTPRTPYGHKLGGENGKTLIFDTFKGLYKKYPDYTSLLVKSYRELADLQCVGSIRLYLGSPEAVFEPLTTLTIKHAVAPLILFPNKKFRIVLDAQGNKINKQSQLIVDTLNPLGIGVDAEPGPGYNTIWANNNKVSCLVLFQTIKSVVSADYAPAWNFDRNAKCSIRVLVNNKQELDIDLLSQWYKLGYIHGIDAPLDTPIDKLIELDSKLEMVNQ